MSKFSGIIFIDRPTLTSGQFSLLADFCKELSQAAIIGAFGVLIIPEAFSLENKISLKSFSLLLLAGLTSLIMAVILKKESK